MGGEGVSGEGDAGLFATRPTCTPSGISTGMGATTPATSPGALPRCRILLHRILRIGPFYTNIASTYETTTPCTYPDSSFR